MEPAALSQQYYVGQNGDQSGPFSEADIISQIQQGMILADALVWHEGMPEWQPIRNFDRFAEAFSGSPEGGLSMGESGEGLGSPNPWEGGPGPSKPSAQELEEEKAKQRLSKKGLKKFRHSEVSTFAFSDKEAKPIYKDNMFRAAGKYIKRRFSMVFFGAILFAVGYGGYQLFISMINPDGDGEPVVDTGKKRGRGARNRGTANTTTPNGAPAAGGSKGSSSLPAIDSSVRAAELQKAKSELLLNSDVSLQTLERLVETNPEDAVGREALETGLLHYKTNQRRSEAGRLLMKAKKPLEASKFFLEDPPQWEIADQALYAAYLQSRAADRADILIQDINILLGPLNRPDLARDRIKVLEKDFPRRKHPFGYYLKSIDGRIADIFNRLSFYFVQTLLTHVSTEFSAMTWVERPVVEILRLRDGKYRIVGRYKGDVILSRDRLSGITFIFWMEGDQWRLVDTDVTDERGRFAATERERLKTRSVLASQMLENLESRFRSKFPKARLHEAVSEGADQLRRPTAD